MTTCPLAPTIRSLTARIAALEGAKAEPTVEDINEARMVSDAIDFILRRGRKQNAPKPVCYEAWVNLYADGVTGAPCASLEEAEAMANPGRVECRKIVWNSGGSPVDANPVGYVAEAHVREIAADRDDWKAKAEDLEANRAAWMAKAEALEVEAGKWKCRAEATSLVENADKYADKMTELHAEIHRLKELLLLRVLRDGKVKWHQMQVESLRADLARCQPVVDAAVAWVAKNAVMRDPYDADLFARVRAYQH